MARKLRIDPWAYLLAASWLVLLPTPWGLGAALAAIVHEICHILALQILCVPIYEVRIGIWGARIDTAPMTRGRELVCALAGPLGSFSMLLLSDTFPEAALWGAAQGCYNLLPFYPLDGGRALRAFFSDSLCRGIEAAALTLLGGIGLFGALALELGIYCILPFISVVFILLNRKTPCKERKQAVQ